MLENASLKDDLIWQIEAGIDECVGEMPQDRFAETLKKLAERPDPRPEPSSDSTRSRTPEAIAARTAPQPPRQENSAPERAIQSAVAAATAATSINQLREAVEAFQECGLKKTAMNTVFADGNPAARIMFIGEAPGPDEDRQGLPFVGKGGVLLDRMLASIDLDRSSCYLTNIIYWRPPGSLKPTDGDLSTCLPFAKRLIELVDPEVLIFLGGAPAKVLLGKSEGISRLRGKWFEYESTGFTHPIAAMAIYHPDYLLGSPAHKREAWQDLLEIKQKLS